MKLLLSILSIFCWCSTLSLAQNQRPIVNITQAYAGKLIGLKYIVTDAENDPVNIEIQYSCDDGNTFQTYPIEYLSGEFGYPITPNSYERYVYFSSFPQECIQEPSLADFMVRVVADDFQPIDIQSVVDEVSHERLLEDMNKIEGIRHFVAGAAHLQEVRDTIANRFVAAQLDTTIQSFTVGSLPGVNIIGTKKGHGTNNKLYIVDAHYDSVNIAPGADDNGSGVIGVLEAMRVLSQYSFDANIQFIGFDLEEAGLIGSHYYLQNNGIPLGQQLDGVLNFEMIGYYSDAPNSQELPAGFNLLFPNEYAEIQANQFRGDFIANVANVNSNPLKVAYDSLSAIYVPQLNIESVALPGNAQIAPDFRRSDHATFWDAGYKALMLTDGANFRNANYHTAQDVSAVLDFDFITNNTKAVVATIANLAGIQHSSSDTSHLELIDAAPHIEPIALQISPNPAQQYTTIQLGHLPADKGVLQIADLHGRLVQQQMVNTHLQNSIRCNIQHFAKGMYVIQFLGEKNTAIARLLVQ